MTLSLISIKIKISSVMLPADVRLSFWPFRVAVAPSVDVHDGILTLTFAGWVTPCMYEKAKEKENNILILESNKGACIPWLKVLIQK